MSDRSFAPLATVIALLAMAAAPSPLLAKPCVGGPPNVSLEELLPQARVALRLPGTRSVNLDPDRRCIAIEVDGSGTARLVRLLLRGVKVPEESVSLVVREPEERPRLPAGA